LSTKNAQANCTEEDGTICAMREPYERLRQIRRIRGFEKQAEAPEAFGWSKNTYKSHENGTRPLSAKAAKRYAAAFRVPVGWLLSGEGGYDGALSSDLKTTLAFERLPLLDWSVVTNTNNIERAVQSATGRADTAPNVSFGPLVFALRVVDESMSDPLGSGRDDFSPGDEIVFDPEKPARPGSYVLARVYARNETVFRQYRETGYTADGNKVVTLFPLNPNYPSDVIIPGETGEVIARLIRHSHDYS
jgi:SOS-response transcriptional repressor LexA